MARGVVSVAALLGLLLAAGMVKAEFGNAAPADYNPKMKYYFFGQLRPDYAYELQQGQQDNNNGFFLATLYEGSFTYQLVHSFKEGVEKIAIYGPRRATTSPGGGLYAQNNPTVLAMEAPLVKELDPFPSSLQGSWSLSQEEFLMLWSQTLFIRIDTEGRPEGALACAIERLDPSSTDLIYMINMEGNNGKYEVPADMGDIKLSSGTANLGIGYMRARSNGNFDVVLYHTAPGAGRLILQCPSGARTVANQATSPVNVNNQDFGDFALEATVPNHCYLYLTTAEYVDGELYAYPMQTAFLDVQMSGAQMVPPVASGYYAVASLWLERNSKWLYGRIRTNLTADDVTAVSLYLTKGNELDEHICDLSPATNNVVTFPRVACIVNQTHFEPIWNGETAVVIKTKDHPSGELRGRQTIAALAAGSGPSNVGMIVGIVIGCVVGVVLIVVIVVLVVKKGGCSRSSKL